MTKKFFFFRLLNPILVMLLLACAILLEKKGFTLEARQPLLPILDKEKIESAVYQEPAVLVIVNRERTDEVPFTITLTDTLNEMKIAFHTTDLSQEELPDLSQFSTILSVCIKRKCYFEGSKNQIKMLPNDHEKCRDA
ncbi:hypothetical protein [Flexilinea flocculi]|uniref:Lipoprotein n=1 Tax=Flexilinea flocculi TaxID=1678840 RepID=A0A0K8PAQ3_9CHLR|nr:hypothetical protein [Flexilinea flocculi]GAP39614.1 hypothetical protein ATC1_12146 [Flexilinea flocculi]